MSKLLKNRIDASKKNSAGFTLVELIVVMTIVGILVGISGGYLRGIYIARAKSCSGKLDGMISQCKINEMSGTSNCLVLKFDSTNKEYVCELYNTDSDGNIAEGAEAYKTEKFGNDQLDIKIGDTNVRTGNNMIIKFNRSTGAVKIFKIGTTDLVENSANDIKVSSGSTYKITLYTLTGVQVYDT